MKAEGGTEEESRTESQKEQGSRAMAKPPVERLALRMREAGQENKVN